MASWHRFFLNFGRFWGQGGRQNGAQIDPKRCRKTMQKTAETRLPKKSQQESQPTRETSGFGSWEGVGGGINPSRREEGSGWHQYKALNHLSPEGWWDFILSHYKATKSIDYISTIDRTIFLGNSWATKAPPKQYQQEKQQIKRNQKKTIQNL